MSQPTRVIILGAGWSGLIAATTYLQISSRLNRPINITILDDGTSPGGVWGKERLYPGLTANSPNGLYEYSQMSMVNDEHPFTELLPGTRVQEYLETFARREGVYDKIKFGVHVKSARRKSGSDPNAGWMVEAEDGEKWECEKLIVATGLYSKARMPEIAQKGYEGISIHSKSMGKMQQKLRDDPNIRNVVVVGGCKSAVEACSLFLPHFNPEKAFRVSWVIRPSEKGVPMAVVDTDKGPSILTFNVTRLFGCLSPSIFWTTGIWYMLFHSGNFLPGLIFMNLLWSLLSWSVKRDARYRTSENGRKIEPKGTTLFYDLNYVSLLPKKASFLEYLHRDNDDILKVHRVTPVELTAREIVIVDENGTKSSLPCDLVIWCTGWEPSMDFFEEEEARALGMPIASVKREAKTTADQTLDSLPTTMLKPAAYWSEELSPEDKAAEQEVIRFFPNLGNPARSAYPFDYSGFRLYRQILPTKSIETGDRSIVFSGLVSNGQTAVCCELTSLWGIAWMEDLLPKELLPLSKVEADRDVELVCAWMRRRYGVRGMRDPEIVLEVQSFFDVICKDLGIAWERKKRGQRRSGWNILAQAKDSIREWTTPYTGKDYVGILDEFLEINGHMKKVDP